MSIDGVMTSEALAALSFALVMSALAPAAAMPKAAHPAPRLMGRDASMSAGAAGRGKLVAPSAASTGLTDDAQHNGLSSKLQSGAMSDAPNIFGTTALRVGRTPLDARWRTACTGDTPHSIEPARRLIASIRHMDRYSQVAAVNHWVNDFLVFTPEPEGHDRWADAARTLRLRRGDCEDFAIAKMALLRALGVPATALYLVVAQDLVRRRAHALLVVRDRGKMLTLDSASNLIGEATQQADYRPILSFSADRSWIHGYGRKPGAVRMAQSGAN